MKVIRFVSEMEKEIYLSGAKLINNDHHINNKTTSVGFCFAEISEKRDAEKWMRKLYLSTACKWCIEFDTDNFSIPLNESTARYSDDEDFKKTIEVREWCSTEYSLQTHPFTRIGKCPSFLGLCLGVNIVWKLNMY